MKRITPALTFASPLELFTGTAGGSPATSTARCEDLAKRSTSNILFALRTHGGRAARGPSEELEWLSAGSHYAISIVLNPIHIGLTIFFTGHALIHLLDIATGHFPPAHWLIDAPGVFVPALIMIVLAVPSVRRRLVSSGR